MINEASKAMLKRALEEKRYVCSGFDEGSQNLKIELGNEGDSRSWKLVLSPSLHELTREGDASSSAGFLNAFMEFPYLCSKEMSGELARYLMLLNKGLPFPAFGLSESEGIIYYRHMLYCAKGMIPVPVVTALTGLISLYVDSLSPSIEAIASGRKSFQEVLEETLSLIP